MTTKAFHRLAICVASLALVVASEANAACADCVPVTFNANINVANLHPSVSAVQMRCQSAGAAEGIVSSAKFPIVDRGYVGQTTLILSIQLAYILSHTENGISALCELWFEGPPGTAMARPLANATQPLLITDANWRTVAAGSTPVVVKGFKLPNTAAP